MSQVWCNPKDVSYGAQRETGLFLVLFLLPLCLKRPRSLHEDLYVAWGESQLSPPDVTSVSLYEVDVLMARYAAWWNIRFLAIKYLSHKITFLKKWIPLMAEELGFYM